MKDTRKILEKDLYLPVQDYFEKLGYEVHGEVKDCDITASKGDELIIIELKRTLNLDLLIQAAKRQRMTEQVYIAIPKPSYSTFTRKWRDLSFIVKRLELGLILVSFKEEGEAVKVVFEPAPFDRRKSMQQSRKKRKSVTGEIAGRHGNYNVGGSTGTKLMTAYKENVVFIACCLKRVEQLSTRELRELGTGEKTQSILANNYEGWFERVKQGVYRLKEEGQEGLKAYPELAAYYEALLEGAVENK